MPDKALAPDTFSSTAAIKACEKGKQWSRSLQILEAMVDQAVALSAVSYVAAIRCCECGQQWSAFGKNLSLSLVGPEL